MDAFFSMMEVEEHPGVRAVLAHWLMGYIHPFPDGNGRTARFLMNAMLASGGFPWVVIRVDDRDEYMGALESASVGNDIRPFAHFIAKRVTAAMSLDSAKTPNAVPKAKGAPPATATPRKAVAKKRT